MISENEKEIIIECAKKYNGPFIYLFGSAVNSEEYNVLPKSKINK